MSIQSSKEIQSETTNLLSQLIKINTTNPPGNETAAANWLSQNLSNEGFKCELIESAPQRGSVITRLKGTGEKPRLLLLSHLDVVGAKAEEWSINPFAGMVKDGFVWGRGALDMKGMTAIEVMTLKLLKRNNVKLKGDVILAATADEEMGGIGGADFLLRNYPEKVFAEYVLNEGGGASMPLRDKNLFTINIAEKGLIWFKIQARGIPGHGSVPTAADNAIMRMNKVVQCLGNYRGNARFVPAVKQFLENIAEEDSNLQPFITRLLAAPEQSDIILDELEKISPDIAEEIKPRIRMTITPTIINGGNKENVIPSECEAVFDCRVLPGQSTAEALTVSKNLLKDSGLDKLSFEVIQAQEPSESSAETPLYNVITEVLKEIEPGCGIVPLLMPGGTDSRFFRRMGAICYGFHPLRSENMYGEKATRREHGIDERISVENLLFGVNVLYETVKRFMT